MTATEPDVSERLAHAFAAWQLYYLAYELEILGLFKLGEATREDIIASRRGDKLAEAILDNSVNELIPEEWQPDPKLGERQLGGKLLSQYYDTFPLELFRWNRFSRRVFHLPHSLEAMLASATFPDMCWEDLLWPFESFIISLEKPLWAKHPDGFDQQYDTILVTKLPKNDGAGYTFSIRWFEVPPRPGARLGFTFSELQHFRQHIKKDQPQKAGKLWERRGVEMQKFSPLMSGSQRMLLHIGPNGFERIITEPQELFEEVLHDREDQFPPWDEQEESVTSFFEYLSVSLRIALGWMLYLESLSSDQLEWRGRNERKQPRAIAGGTSGVITEPEHICRIIGRGRIDPAALSDEPRRQSTHGFKRPHWRRAHYKRPRGSPQGTPKTVRIPAVLVREDLVPLYGVIGGTETVVIPEE